MTEDAQPPTAAAWTARLRGGSSVDQASADPQERTRAMLTYAIPVALMLVTAGTLGLPAAVVMFLVYKDRGPFLRATAANSLNVQIMAVLGLFLSALLFVVLLGYVTYVLVLALSLGIGVLGLIRAHRGEAWTPPFTPRMVR